MGGRGQGSTTQGSTGRVTYPSLLEDELGMINSSCLYGPQLLPPTTQEGTQRKVLRNTIGKALLPIPAFFPRKTNKPTQIPSLFVQ